MIERWTQEQALILLAIGLSIIFVEVSVLLSTFFACSKNSKRKKSQTSTFTSTQTLSPFNENDHDFGNKIYTFLVLPIMTNKSNNKLFSSIFFFFSFL